MKQINNIKSWFMNTFAIDLRALSLTRISIGVFILWDIFNRLYYLSIHWYTSNLMESITHVNDTPHKAWFHQVLFYRGSKEFQIFSFLLQIVITVTFTIGYRTQVFTFLTWLSVCILHGKQEGICDASDRLLRNMLLFCCFLPMGEYCSLDVHLSKKERHGIKGYVNSASFGLLIQIVFMYWGVVFQRYYMGSEWFPWNGSAMHYIMSGALHSTWLAHYLSNFPLLMYILTLQAMLFEILIPLSILCTSSIQYSFSRFYIAIFLVSFHLAIRCTLILTNFTLLNIITAFILLPSICFDSYLDINNHKEIKLASSTKKTTTTTLKTTTTSSLSLLSSMNKNDKPQDDEIKKRMHFMRSSNCFHSFSLTKLMKYISYGLVMYMFYHFSVTDLRLLPSLDDGNIGQSLRFTQDWRMFRNSIPYGWYMDIIGVFKTKEFNKTKIYYKDLLNNSLLKNRTNKTNIPNVSSIRYPHWRYERWIYKLIDKSPKDRYQKLMTLTYSICKQQEKERRRKESSFILKKIHFHMYIYQIYPPYHFIRYGNPFLFFQYIFNC